MLSYLQSVNAELKAIFGAPVSRKLVVVPPPAPEPIEVEVTLVDEDDEPTLVMPRNQLAGLRSQCAGLPFELPPVDPRLSQYTKRGDR